MKINRLVSNEMLGFVPHPNHALGYEFQSRHGLGGSKMLSRQQTLSNSNGQFNDMKTIGRKSVIFPAFIHNANISMRCSLIIRNQPIQFSHLQRGRISFIIEAYSKFYSLILHG